MSDCKIRTQENIGEDVENWRRQVNLTQKDLATSLGMSDKEYRRIFCNCAHPIPARAARLLSYYMGISIDYLIPELEPDEDERYIKNLKTRGDLYSRRILDRLKKNTEPSSEADKTISECVGKMLSVKDESLKNLLALQLEGLVKIIDTKSKEESG